VASPKQASGDSPHLRLVGKRGGGGGRTVYAVVLGVVWLVIVWLLFVSFVDTGRDDGTTPPTKTQPASGSEVPYTPQTSSTGK
jgi:hypothetical protein